MLFLQITLLAVLLAAGDNEDAFQEQISFHMIHISSFYNHSWTQNWGSGWLGELQILGWNSNSYSVIFLRPCSKGNFSNEEITKTEKYFRRLHIELPPLIRKHASEWKFECKFNSQNGEVQCGWDVRVSVSFPFQFFPAFNYFSNLCVYIHCNPPYYIHPTSAVTKLSDLIDYQWSMDHQLATAAPKVSLNQRSPIFWTSRTTNGPQTTDPFEVQMTGGCELHPREGKVVFLQFAYQGSELLNFQNNSWLPSSKGDNRAQEVCRIFNQRHVAKMITQRLLWDTCPRFLLGLFDAGKADLQRKVKPEAWLSTGPNPGPGHQLLVCHVSGFHPKPIWVKWMRGEHLQQGTQQSGILPNADGTWYLQVFLEVEATETSGLYCRVRHSSLGGQDILLYLEHHQGSVGWIILAVMLPLVLLTALAFWLRKRWSHCEPPATLLPLGFQQHKDSGHI